MVWCSSVCLSHLPALAPCGGFAAVGQAGRRYRSIAAQPAVSSSCMVAMADECGQCHVVSVCTPWVKKTRHQTLGQNFTNYYPIFKIFFTSQLSSKFATNLCLNIPPRFQHVATLPCEMWMQKKWHHSETRIAINDQSQGNIAKNLRCDELLFYTFIIQSAGKRICKIGEHLAKLPQNCWLCHIPHSPCSFVLNDADLAR